VEHPSLNKLVLSYARPRKRADYWGVYSILMVLGNIGFIYAADFLRLDPRITTACGSTVAGVGILFAYWARNQRFINQLCSVVGAVLNFLLLLAGLFFLGIVLLRII
jgi:hypothetical protein